MGNVVYMAPWKERGAEGEGRKGRKGTQEFDESKIKKVSKKKKTSGTKKLFFLFPSTFSNTQKESKNNIDRFYNHISEFFESY